MLIDKVEPIATVKVHTAFSPAAEDYPHYRLIPVQTEAGSPDPQKYTSKTLCYTKFRTYGKSSDSRDTRSIYWND